MTDHLPEFEWLASEPLNVMITPNPYFLYAYMIEQEQTPESTWERFRLATERHLAAPTQQTLDEKNAAATAFYLAFCGEEPPQ